VATELDTKGASVRRLRKLLFGSGSEKLAEILADVPAGTESPSDPDPTQEGVHPEAPTRRGIRRSARDIVATAPRHTGVQRRSKFLTSPPLGRALPRGHGTLEARLHDEPGNRVMLHTEEATRPGGRAAAMDDIPSKPQRSDHGHGLLCRAHRVVSTSLRLVYHQPRATSDHPFQCCDQSDGSVGQSTTPRRRSTSFSIAPSCGKSEVSRTPRPHQASAGAGRTATGIAVMRAMPDTGS